MDDKAPPPRTAIDWATVHQRLARRNAAMEQAFAGTGPWAEQILRRRAEELAERPDSIADDRPAISLLLARGAATLYGLELRHLVQIVPMPRLARVPGAVPAMLGVIAVGGKVMRLFDIDRLCGAASSPMPRADGDPGHAVVLRTVGGRTAALRVRTVERVADIDPPRHAAPPEAGAFIKAITGDRVAVLDMAALLDFVKT